MNAGPKSPFVSARIVARTISAAKMQEILLPADDKAFNFKELPDPDLDKAKEDNSQIAHEGAGPLWRAARPGETPHPFPAGPTAPPGGSTAPSTVSPAVAVPTTAAAPAAAPAAPPPAPWPLA